MVESEIFLLVWQRANEVIKFLSLVRLYREGPNSGSTHFSLVAQRICETPTICYFPQIPSHTLGIVSYSDACLTDVSFVNDSLPNDSIRYVFAFQRKLSQFSVFHFFLPSGSAFLSLPPLARL